ncbi:MAG: hypothetical protein HKN42_11350, partial [Granulosicoccus sp.]|nr:hypothetical protein [Granulosicoccus sp.]
PDGQLAVTAMASLVRQHAENVHLKHDPGTDGWLEQAPFDAIIVSGAIAHIPLPLTDQLVLASSRPTRRMCTRKLD